MFPRLSMMELVLVFGVVVLFFGGKRIPQIARGLGEGIRNFKTSLKDPERLEKGDAPGRGDDGKGA